MDESYKPASVAEPDVFEGDPLEGHDDLVALLNKIPEVNVDPAKHHAMFGNIYASMGMPFFARYHYDLAIEQYVNDVLAEENHERRLALREQLAIVLDKKQKLNGHGPSGSENPRNRKK